MANKDFKNEYAKLNPEQKKAVDTIEGPVMVIAGPGTGKTTILTLRIANILLKTDVGPSGILALTFTEAGVKAMKMKLRRIIGNTADEININTFHGFAAGVIREFADHFPHLANSKQITDVEAESMIRKILKGKKFSKLRPLGDPDFYVQKILVAIRESKKEAWTPEMLEIFAKEEIERIKNDENSISKHGASKGKLKAEAESRINKCERTILLAEVYGIYEKTKRDEKKMDFDDLIFELQKALREDKLLLQSLQERFLYILLDEHQDTNDAQNMIVRLIADFFESPNLFIVGDEKQAIYRFQGASLENFLKFQRIWGTMKVIKLESNYRSHQSILDAAFKMIEQNYEENEFKDLRAELKSASKEKASPIELVESPNPAVEENFLVEKIKGFAKSNPDKTIAVIVRKNREVEQIFYLLQKSGLDVSAESGADIFSHPIGQIFFSLIEFLADPSKIEALAETLAGGLWSFSFSKRAMLIKSIRSGNMEKIEKEIPELAKIGKKISSAGPLEFLAEASELSGLTEMAGRSPLSAAVWKNLFDLSKDLAFSDQIESPRILIESLLDYKKTAEKKHIKIGSGNPLAQISIMTAHGSKGLEFDYVFLPFATEESWISRGFGSFFVFPREKEKEDNIRDERRLFYVGLTRAKNHVCISYSVENGLGKPLSPLRFLSELDANHLHFEKLQRFETDKKSAIKMGKKITESKEEIDYTKRILLEDGLSVTALNHFLECPNKFFYKSILKLPEAPNGSSEKGTAMHEAIANIWKKSDSKKNIEEIIISSVKNYFSRSLLAAFEKETALEELLANASKVAEALKPHFEIEGKVLTEKWEEAEFKHCFKKDEIDLKLHGRLDTLIERENEVLVFDYKTREAMSANAIKGETENSDGNYFRQLVFYKMLLERNPKFMSREIKPSLVFVKPDKKGRCPTVSLPIGKEDISKVESEIKLLLEKVWSGQFLHETCSEKNCKYCGFRKSAES